MARLGESAADLDFDLALEYVRTARELGVERGLLVSVAVVDAAGHPVLVARGSRKWHGPYMAVGKARLAAAFEKPTSQLLEMWQDRPLFAASLPSVLPGEVTLNPGGHPIVIADVTVGAIGVGGGSPKDDAEIARLTVAALAERGA